MKAALAQKLSFSGDNLEERLEELRVRVSNLKELPAPLFLKLDSY